jgi:hypothetical protein
MTLFPQDRGWSEGLHRRSVWIIQAIRFIYVSYRELTLNSILAIDPHQSILDLKKSESELCRQVSSCPPLASDR